jgi:hypothetical protein
MYRSAPQSKPLISSDISAQPNSQIE